MGAFKTVIGCNPDQYDTGSFAPTKYLILDTQESKSVSASSTIAKQPMQSGDTIADHMYRDPSQFSVSGFFSLNGKNWDDDSYDFMQKGDRLTNIQEVFEFIKDNGILCTITTIEEDDFSALSGGSRAKVAARTRFKTREHMALISITWEERQNSVKYSFKFEEVIMVEPQGLQEYEELPEEERRRLGLPNVTSPAGSNLGTVLAESGELDKTIVTTLYDNGYIENDFLRVAAQAVVAYYGTAVTVLAAVAVAKGILVAGAFIAAGIAKVAALAGIAASTSAIFPVGTVVVAAAAAVAVLAIGIVKIVKFINKQEKQKKAFKLINGKPDQDLDRLKNLLDDIRIEVNKVKTGLTIYSINGNVRQTVLLSIAGEYYKIEFDRMSADESSEWRAKVSDMEGNSLPTLYHSWCPVSSFTDLNRNQNLWFKDKTLQYEVYLMNPSLNSEVNPTKEEMDNAKADLEGYSIWVSKGDIQKNVKAVQDAIEKAIEDYGFGD